MSQLRTMLGLGEVKLSSTAAQAEEFGRQFRERMDQINREMRVVATHASPAVHQSLEGQRRRLIEAFQKTSAQIDSVDPTKADEAIQRVMTAIDLVAGKTSKSAEDAKAARDQWLEREAEFDNAMLQIGELEETGHAKAAALRKLGDAIRDRAHGREFQPAVTVLGKLCPKLEIIYTQHQEQVAMNAESTVGEEEVRDGSPREGLTILIRDQVTGDAIEGARVAIGDQSDVTSSNGLATVELHGGAHRCEVSSEHYEPQSRDVDVIEGDNPELIIELTASEAPDTGEANDLTGSEESLEALSRQREACTEGIDNIIQEHSAEEAGESATGLFDGDWNVIDGLQTAADVVGQGIEKVAGLPDELASAAKDVGVDLLMFGAEQVVEQRGLIEMTMQGAEGVLDSNAAKMLALANPALEISRSIGVNLARAGEATPEVAQQLIDNEQGIRALTQMNQRETTQLALEQIDVGETYETEFHGGAEIHAELGVKAGAQAESKMTKVSETEFQLELTVGGKLQVGVGASAQGEGAAADVGGGIGGKVVVDVKGETPEEARAQVATLIQLANGEAAEIEQIAQLKGVTISEAEGKIAAILSGDLTPLSVGLRGDVIPEYRIFGDKGHVGMGAALTIKAETGTPVNIVVPDNVASLTESPDLGNLDPRARTLLGDLPMDVVEEIEDLYGRGGLKLGAEVQVEANLYAPTDVGIGLAEAGGLAKHANRLEVTLKGKIEAGNSNIEITHQVVVKDLQGLSEAAGMGAEQLAVAMQDGAVTPEELCKLIPNQKDLDKFVDFNSKAEISHFDGIKIDVLGFGGHLGESNKLTLYEVQDGQMIQKVDDLESALDQMEAKTRFGLLLED